ncbi:MAG: TolB family protein [Phycisphaerales bacterium]|jgi:TolB protein|nr:hypothetical protein [Phycisphaeraceae bacterium]
MSTSPSARGRLVSFSVGQRVYFVLALTAGLGVAVTPSWGQDRPASAAPVSASAPAPAPAAAAPPAPPLDWAALEAGTLSDHVQLTYPEQFSRAGEAYFDHQTPPRWIVFQAVAAPASGQAPSPHFAMYVARLRWQGEGAEAKLAGIDEPMLISEPGSANTCGWFHPTSVGTLMFGSTVIPPTEETPAGFSRDRSRYQWQFPKEMRVMQRVIRPILEDHRTRTPISIPMDEGVFAARPLFERPGGQDAGGYAAECSWSSDGRHILYTYVDPRTKNPDLWAYDTRTQTHTVLINAKGYNGGGFFAPDDRAIVYRSDRRGDNLLQLFTATLAFDDPADAGRITGVRHEFALTDNQQVNWAPFYHPSGQFIVYATSEEGHSNYEIFSMQLPDASTMAAGPAESWPAKRDALVKRRITHATGFDGLPAFSSDGSWLIFTSQRAGPRPGEQRPTSQVWAARWSVEGK